MRAQPVDLIGGYYADDTLPWSSQDTVNWLPVVAEVAGTRTPKYLKTPPGLKPYQNIGTGPIRGMHDLEGARFIVSGRYLFRISNTGVGIPIGIIPGVGRVSMTHNQFKTGYQLLVENGQGGGGYVYDSTTQTFGRITDPGYPGSISSDYLDSYTLGVEPQGRFWFHSNLADATDYNTLDRYEAEASPDKIVGLAVSQFEVVVFGQRTTEFFYNVGTATGTFQNRRQAITRGCASRHSIAKLDNTLFWLGDDGIVYRLNGYAALPVSTGPMHRAFAGLNWAEAFAYVWEDRGFKVYYLTFPDGYTWAYDVVSGLWTRSQSFGLKRRRLTHTVKWGNQWFGGDFQDGRIWELDWDYLLEGDEEFISERTSPVLHDNQSSVGIPNAELIFDTGQGPMTEAIPFPVQPNNLAITGTLPSGTVGMEGQYQYVISGAWPTVAVAVDSGSLPPGATLSLSGLVTYSYDIPGSYYFRLRVTDGIGNTAFVDNTVTISNLPMLLRGQSGTNAVVIRSLDGLNWSAAPISTGGFGTPLLSATYLTGLSGRFFGRSLGGVTPAAYSDNQGATWTATAANVIVGGFSGSNGDAYCAGKLFLPAHTGNYQVSSDNGVTFQDGGLVLGRLTALTRTGSRIAAIQGGGTFRESLNGGTTWSPGFAIDSLILFLSGGCNGSDGRKYYFGGTMSSTPRLITVLDGVATVVPLPSLPGAVAVTGFSAGSGIKVVGTDNGRIAYDNGDGAGFRASATVLPAPVRQILWVWTHFIAVVSPTGGAAGAVYTSVDGNVWTQRALSGPYALSSVAQLRSL